LEIKLEENVSGQYRGHSGDLKGFRIVKEETAGFSLAVG